MILDRVPLKPLWAPSRAFVEQSNLKKFQNWLFVKKGLYFRDYHDLWDWSVTDLEDFWESIWQFCDVKTHSIYWDVLVNPQKNVGGTQWFTGATINYAEHIFRHKNANRPALLYQSERESLRELSWRELEKQVAAVAAYLRQSGVGVGDKVAAILPNSPQAVVAFLATNSLGAVWSILSPDLDNNLISNRLQQIEPKVLLLVDGYCQNTQSFDNLAAAKGFMGQLPTLKKTILLPHLNPLAQLPKTDLWANVLKTPASPLEFTPVPFQHPLWILFDDPATNKAKKITHSVGGCLLEHLKTLAIHQNVKLGERFFWYGNTNSLAWNFSVASMLVGATPVLYEGTASHPDKNVLWDIVEKAKVNHLGIGTSYFVYNLEEKVTLQGYKFNQLQSITVTDSVLPVEGYEWVYQNIKKDVWVNPFPYNAELCSSFSGACSSLPIFANETQWRLLGCKLESLGLPEKAIRNEFGEMLLAQPMPSLPLYVFNP